MALAQEKLRRPSSIKSCSHTFSGMNVDLDDQGLGRRFLEKLSANSDKIHQVDAVSGITETNGSVRERSIMVAMEMKSRGIRENDVVLICSRSHSDQTVVVLATLLLGAIVAPLDPESAQDDFKNFVITLKPKLAFCDVRPCAQIETIIRNSAETPACILVVFGVHSERLSFDKFLLQKPISEYKSIIVKDTKRKVAFVVSSQSTTGEPKLVCISHHSITLQIANYASSLFRTVEKVLSFFPLSWITQAALTCYCYDSNVIRILPGNFSERSACKLIHDLRIDCAILGTQYTMRIVRHSSLQDYDLSELKIIYLGGVLTTAGDITFIRNHFKGTKVLQCYGVTEMSCLVSAFAIDEYKMALEKPGSVGKPLPGIKYKIADLDTREVLAPDWWGELLVTGPTFMLGYYKDIAGTHNAMEKGYFRTGDVAQYDSEGYLYIQGRVSDHIMREGQRFFPNELEDLIESHPHVKEVVVLGDDKDMIACVVKKPGCYVTDREIFEFVEERMPVEKRPTKIKFMEGFPRTTTGKIKRHLIKQAVLGTTIVHSSTSFTSQGSR